jgi:hypothetical protein
MAAEEIAVDPYKGKVQKLRILAENSQGTKLDRLVLTAMYEAMAGQTWPSDAGKVPGNDQTIGILRPDRKARRHRVIASSPQVWGSPARG